MIKVHLVLANTDRRGERYAIDAPQYRIGRQEECQLRLESGKISRNHCRIIRAEDSVVIEDLGSRNGTYINDRKIDRNKQCRLWHRDKIQIGNFLFRISVRDAITGNSIEAPKRTPSDETDPILEPDPAGSVGTLDASELMSELEEMATQLEVTVQTAKSTWHELGRDASKNAAAGQDQVDREATPEPSAANETQDDLPLTTIVDLKRDNKKEPTADSKDRKPKPVVEELQSDETEELTKGPMPIPEHLRPKAPADSTDAASKALKRYFGA